MDLKRLRTFVAVAEHGTVSKAAAVLNITQPALSRQIGSLEHEFGFELFERVRPPPRCSPPRGEQLLGDCRSLLACVGRAGRTRAGAAARRHQGAEGRRLGADHRGAAFRLSCTSTPSAVPGVRVALVEADADEHLNLLERGDAHLAINVINNMQVDDNRFASYVLPPFQMLAACARSLQDRRRRHDRYPPALRAIRCCC